jgi:hypothetical protein
VRLVIYVRRSLANYKVKEHAGITGNKAF